METDLDVVHCYAQLAHTVTHMLELARAREWTRLPALDQQCTAFVDRLRAMEPHPELAAMDRARVVALLTRIRSDQHELQELIRPQCQRLMHELHQLHRQQKLHGAYRGAA
ncbi:flagellar protein FliT [Ramlibacter sp.]|uniref:flagellar protein FliT n=1 Tax=Ramlibacter sp. TaxID=1917967 RepID=UPI002CA06F1E|nr:flagellar protein FliT [Ramlibacter sp.]HWI83368.1 flagellar protein FliT [Ramlibacter sp.]